MMTIRPAAARGHADYGWLRTWHSFSFADYYDPAEMGWGALRVINEDIVAPAQGFPTHGHRDMEIVTVMLAGALQHRDSMGHGAVIRPGEVQRMSAGTGVKHSEFNPSQDEAAHLLQIWIRPAVAGSEPGYEQTAIAGGDAATLLASPDGRDGSVRIGQQATLWRVRLAAGESFELPLAPGRLGYAHLIDGEVEAAGEANGAGVRLARGDGLKVADEGSVRFVAGSASDFLWFDLPA
jgi:quercetin 2,3-dioxygenase